MCVFARRVFVFKLATHAPHALQTLHPERSTRSVCPQMRLKVREKGMLTRFFSQVRDRGEPGVGAEYIVRGKRARKGLGPVT